MDEKPGTPAQYDEDSKIEKSFSMSVHIDFLKSIEKRRNWKLNPNETYLSSNENERDLFTYEEVRYSLEGEILEEYEVQLRSYFKNDSIRVVHDATNKGSIELVFTIIGYFNDLIEFFEGTKKIKEFTQRTFKSKLTNKYGNYFNVKTDLINDPNTLSFKDIVDRFLWFCAGDKIEYIIQCPTDHVKHASFGALVFMTAFLAFLSGGYAFYSVVNNPLLSFGFAIVWSTLIFCLDRYMISSMKKEGKTSKELQMAFPRFLIAIVIAFVISNPLDLLIFNKEITLQLDKEKLELQKKQTKNSIYSTEIFNYKYQIDSIKKIINNNVVKIHLLRDTLTGEIQGRVGSGIPGEGIAARSIKQNLIAYEKENTCHQTEIKLINDRLNDNNKAREAEVAKLMSQQEKTNGILAKNIALSKIMREPDNSFALYTFLGLLLLLLLIETSPIIAKILSGKGAYDSLIDKLEKERIDFLFKQEEKEILRITEEYLNIQREQLYTFDRIQRVSSMIEIGDETNPLVINYLREEHLQLQKVLSEKYRSFIIRA